MAVRRRLSNRIAYGLSAGVIGLGLYASTTPSPLYGSYSALWHFSALTLTLIYATYAFGVLATLLLVGGVSDDVGRRAVMLVALAGLMGASVLFLLADSAAWLFVARGLQGLATGAALSAASASMLDLHPRRAAAGVALTNATTSAGGLGLGMLVSSSLVQIGWHPRLLPYLFLLLLIAVAFVGTLLMPEPVHDRKRFRLTIERPRVPAAVRRPFVLAALAVISSWSIAALFFSLGPQLAGQLFHTSNAITGGVGVVALTASAVVAQLLTGRSAPWVAAAAGSVALAGGVALIVVAAATNSPATYLAGAILGGMGFGAAYFGALRALVAKIPAPHRAAVMAAFYVVGYGSLSVPAILAGIAVTYISLQPTFEIFGSVVAAVGLAVAFEACRTRPRAERQTRTAEPNDTLADLAADRGTTGTSDRVQAGARLRLIETTSPSAKRSVADKAAAALGVRAAARAPMSPQRPHRTLAGRSMGAAVAEPARGVRQLMKGFKEEIVR